MAVGCRWQSGGAKGGPRARRGRRHVRQSALAAVQPWQSSEKDQELGAGVVCRVRAAPPPPRRWQSSTQRGAKELGPAPRRPLAVGGYTRYVGGTPGTPGRYTRYTWAVHQIHLGTPGGRSAKVKRQGSEGRPAKSRSRDIFFDFGVGRAGRPSPCLDVGGQAQVYPGVSGVPPRCTWCTAQVYLVYRPHAWCITALAGWVRSTPRQRGCRGPAVRSTVLPRRPSPSVPLNK